MVDTNEEASKLTQYQLKQIDYVKGVEAKIQANNWDPLDINAQCKTCAVSEEHLGTSAEIEAFINKHAGHYTWTTNNHK